MAATQKMQAMVAVIGADGADRRYVFSDGLSLRPESLGPRVSGVRLKVGIVAEGMRFDMLKALVKGVDAEVLKLKRPNEMIRYRPTLRDNTYEWAAVPLRYVEMVYADLKGARVEELVPYALAVMDGGGEPPEEGWMRIEPLGDQVVIVVGKGKRIFDQECLDIGEDVSLEIHRASGKFQGKNYDGQKLLIKKYVLAPGPGVEGVKLRSTNETIQPQGRTGLDVLISGTFGCHFPNLAEELKRQKSRERQGTLAVAAVAGFLLIVAGGGNAFLYSRAVDAEQTVERAQAEEKSAKREVADLLKTKLIPLIADSQPKWSLWLRDFSNAFPPGSVVKNVKVDGGRDPLASRVWKVSGTGQHPSAGEPLDAIRKTVADLPKDVKIAVGTGTMNKSGFVLSGEIKAGR